MPTPKELLHNDVTEKIIGAFFDVYNILGYGLLESVYQRSLPIALAQAGLRCCREMELPVYFQNHIVGEFRADLVVENKVLVETKTASRIHPVHELQLFNYLKIANLQVGLILNFGPKPTFQRYILSPRADRSA